MASAPPQPRYPINSQTQNVRPPKLKSLTVAYLLWFPPFGILGFHRFYLGHLFHGILYLFTLGYFGIGWLADCFLLRKIVKDTNWQIEYDAEHPEEMTKVRENECACRPLYYCSVIDAYILTLPPFGIFGFQHHYIHRPWYRAAYTLTGGLFGIGWISDFFRIPSLVEKVNEDTRKLRQGMPPAQVSLERDCDVVQAYLLAIPGFFGFHHFYLGRWSMGLTYMFTFGLCGIGWLGDLLRMPYLVKRCDTERRSGTLNHTKHVDDAYLYAFPLGILGFHHFYLDRPVWGFTYLFTAGLFGIGWLVDLLRMKQLVADANLRARSQQAFLIPAHSQYPSYTTPSQENYPRQQQYPSYPPPPGQYPPGQYTSQYASAPPSNQPPQYAATLPDGTIEPPPTYTQSVTDPSSQIKQYPPP